MRSRRQVPDAAAPLELTSWRVFRLLFAHLTEPPQGGR